MAKGIEDDNRVILSAASKAEQLAGIVRNKPLGRLAPCEPPQNELSTPNV
jgi:hypothetical protein